MDSLTWLAVQLPEDIEKTKWHGDFPRAKKLIHQKLQSSLVPEVVKKRLRIELEILDRLPMDYCYSEEEALQMMQKDIPDFTMEELRDWEDRSAIDWIYIDGKPALSRRFYETLLKVYPEIASRAGKAPEKETPEKKLLQQNILDMQKKGSTKYRIRMKAKIQLHEELFKPGKTFLAHLPLPIPAENIANISILSYSPAEAIISPEDSLQRTISWEGSFQENPEFTVEYQYDCIAPYHVLDPAKVLPQQPDFDTEEVYPHIIFTPTIRALAEEIKGDEKNPLCIARKFYDFCTKNVTYSYMREYFTLTQIPEYAALGGKGDCGVQALLFITLCRCAGIPAKWQSGLFVTPYSQGCHDWAQFYIAPYGWLFADPSFGGSGFRSGNALRHDHYFGNLDPFRMAANTCFQGEINPMKQFRRSDPYDNQKGEIESNTEGYVWHQFESSWELISMELLP